MTQFFFYFLVQHIEYKKDLNLSVIEEHVDVKTIKFHINSKKLTIYQILVLKKSNRILKLKNN